MSDDRQHPSVGQSSEQGHGYEGADLGDECRTSKFMRLMGSKKKEEHKTDLKTEDRTEGHGYEGADLGDDNRRDKFLRLMGSKKKEEHKTDLKSQTSAGEIMAAEQTEEIVDVKSANEWESANMGDVSRKNKFLRLMGATKKEHSGKFVIGQKEKEEVRQTASKEEVDTALEKQYNQGLQLRLTGAARRHKGFGFEEPPQEETKPTDSAGTTDEGTGQPSEVRNTVDSAQVDRDRQNREDRRYEGRSEFARREHHSDTYRREPQSHDQRRRDYSRDSYRGGDRDYHRNRQDSRQYRDSDHSRDSKDYNRDREGHYNRDHGRELSRDKHERSGYEKSVNIPQQQSGENSGRNNRYSSSTRSNTTVEASSQQQGFPGQNPYSGHHNQTRSSTTPVIGDYGTPVAASSVYEGPQTAASSGHLQPTGPQPLAGPVTGYQYSQYSVQSSQPLHQSADQGYHSGQQTLYTSGPLPTQGNSQYQEHAAQPTVQSQRNPQYAGHAAQPPLQSQGNSGYPGYATQPNLNTQGNTGYSGHGAQSHPSQGNPGYPGNMTQPPNRAQTKAALFKSKISFVKSSD